MARRAKPAIVVVDPIRARCVRGPRADGRWYWRAEVYSGGHATALWSGWAHREEVGPRLRALDPARRASDASVETLGDLLDYWFGAVKARADLRPRSVIAYRTSARALRRHLGTLRVDRLDASDMDRAKDLLLRAYAPLTAALCLDVLRVALSWAWKVGLIAKEPPSVPRIREPRTVRERRTPAPHEVRLVVECLRGWRRLLVVLMWCTGARLGEICSLAADAYDRDRGTLRLDGKTGPREAPLPPQARAALDEWTPGARSLLGVTPSSARCVERSIRAACDAGGIRRWTPHGLRRLAVDQLARAGVDVATAADLLGHSPAVMLRHYRQVDDEDRRKAVTAARLGAAPEGQVIEMTTRRK